MITFTVSAPSANTSGVMGVKMIIKSSSASRWSSPKTVNSTQVLAPICDSSGMVRVVERGRKSTPPETNSSIFTNQSSIKIVSYKYLITSQCFLLLFVWTNKCSRKKKIISYRHGFCLGGQQFTSQECTTFKKSMCMRFLIHGLPANPSYPRPPVFPCPNHLAPAPPPCSP